MESWSDHPWLKLVVGARNQIEMAREGRPGYGMKLSPLVDVCFAALAINIKKKNMLRSWKEYEGVRTLCVTAPNST
jgi:hypothetical protein